MNYNFRATESLIKLPVGLTELMSDMCREVLRHQPDDINGFLADYLESLLVVREKLRVSSSNHLQIYDEYKRRVTKAMEQCGFDQAKICKAIETIEAHQMHDNDVNDELRIPQMIADICAGFQMNDSHATQDRMHAILKDSWEHVRQSDMTRKIINHDYRWINGMVEQTLDFYRKRQRNADKRRMALAAVRIQRAYRQYRNGSMLIQAKRMNDDNRAKNGDNDMSNMNASDLNAADSVIRLPYISGMPL